MNPVLHAALEYAKDGYPVVACRERPTRYRSGRTIPAKAPYGGIKAATVDLDEVRAMWVKYPRALVGIVPPPPLVVIDIDPRAGGNMAALADLCGADVPVTRTSVSGRGDGGGHLWFTASRLDLVQRSLGPGLDTRIHGKGLVIVPPSLHPVTGRPYTWTSLAPAAPLPAPLEALLAPAMGPGRPADVSNTRTRGQDTPGTPRALKAPYRRYGYQGLVDIMSTCPPGSRNTTLNNIAFTFTEEGQPEAAFSALASAASAAGLPPGEVRATITSARTAGKQRGAA